MFVLIISLSGIDCAGKSTQIHLLRHKLESLSTSSPRILWFRPGYSDEMNFLRSLARRVAPRVLPTTAQPDAREALFSRPAVSKTWVRMALFDTFLQYALKLRLDRVKGHDVICDRYLADAMLDFELRFPHLHVTSWKTLTWVNKVCPKPDISFLLMLSKPEMIRRMAIKKEPFPDDPVVRDKRYARYESLAASGHFIVINAERSIEQVHEEIMSHISRLSK